MMLRTMATVWPPEVFLVSPCPLCREESPECVLWHEQRIDILLHLKKECSSYRVALFTFWCMCSSVHIRRKHK